VGKFTKAAAIRIGEMILNKYPDGILNKTAKETIKKVYKEAGIGKPKGTPSGSSGINPQSKSGLSNKGSKFVRDKKKGKVKYEKSKYLA
jgi:hypothetical protein